MHLVYFSHSYREADAGINEVFEELMLSEGMTPSLDPPSDRLNSAKPERHLRSTDGMVAILPSRDTGPSKYILYEIELCRRARKPVLVFVEDTLPSGVLPPSVLCRRFCRRSLLRELRNHRHAIRTLKAFIGDEPPPTYQPHLDQRYCVLVGVSRFRDTQRDQIRNQMSQLGYSCVEAESGANCMSPQGAEMMQAALTVAWIDKLGAREAYCLGALQGGLVPAITLTSDREYRYDPRFPKEYQPRTAPPSRSGSFLEVLKTEVEIFEEDYLDLKDQEKAKRYRAALIHIGGDGEYGAGTRMNVTNIVSGHARVDMSKSDIRIGGNAGMVVVDSAMNGAITSINQAVGIPSGKRDELAALLEELRAALKPIESSHPDASQRIAQVTELAASELKKEKPDRGFLDISLAGLKSAAEAVKDVAPAILDVAGKVASFASSILP